MYLIAARAIITRATGTFFALSALTAGAQVLQPFSTAGAGKPPPPWRVVGLPAGKKPLSEFDVVQLEGQSVLRVWANNSYGNLTHVLPRGTVAGVLQWRWRLEQAITSSNLREKNGDDVAIKVCAMFDLPLDNIGFMERNLLRIARRASGEYLPGATLCYVWEPKLPEGTELTNAFTGRVHYLVLNSAATPLGQWVSHTRDLRADFLRSFGAETETVPPVLAIAVGADADNTHETGLAYTGDMVLVKQ
jgi:hypothetical protein